MVAKYDPSDALMINRDNRILSVLHLVCCGNPKLSAILHSEWGTVCMNLAQ